MHCLQYYSCGLSVPRLQWQASVLHGMLLVSASSPSLPPGPIIGLELSSNHPGCGKLEFALTWSMAVLNVLDTNTSLEIPSVSAKMNLEIQARTRRSPRALDGLIPANHPPWKPEGSK